MRFPEITESLECTVYHKGENFDTAKVENITAGDLMSEVLVFDVDNLLLVTALNSEQALRTAAMVDALAVILVNDKIPGPGMLALAEELDITLLSVGSSMFDTCAILDRLQHKEP